MEILGRDLPIFRGAVNKRINRLVKHIDENEREIKKKTHFLRKGAQTF